jgi:broad specificity phosphatase PhoE
VLTVRFVRHGESAANAGTATSDPALIPLTQNGWSQAMAVAESFAEAPDLIVTSPFERAKDTALPTIQRFPHAPINVWPIQEFTYLSPARCVDTTALDRKPWVDSYWNSAEPDRTDGPGTEAFSGLIARARSTLSRLRGMSGHVVIFGHGQVMQAVRWLILESPERIDSESMRAFRSFDLAKPIANCEVIEFSYESHRWIYKSH